ARLLGRERELAAVSALLDHAVVGRGRAVLVLGEAGIGKTRIAEDLGDLALGQGCTAAWGRCHDGEAPAYWPWRQALRALVGDRADALLEAADGPRPALFGAVVEALEAATAAHPAVVVLEDLHWADPSTLAL